MPCEIPVLDPDVLPTPAKLEELRDVYRRALYTEVIPFWEGSVDTEYGGYFTCYDGDHRVYDTDKFVWLQARQVWMFSKLAHETEDAAQRERWVAIARSGADFLRRHCGEGGKEDGDGYFSVKRDGSPLVAPYNIFSDCFMAIAYAWYGVVSGEQWAKDLGWKKFRRVEERKAAPKGKWEKSVGRSLRSMALPLIDVNLCSEFKEAFPTESTDELAERVARNIETIVNEHPHPETKLLRETLGDDDCHETRLFNPGHALEACWFMLDAATSRGTADAIVELSRAALEHGWDKEHDGIFYFMDLKGNPPQQLEWDRKLWWVHLEAWLCALQCFRYTREAYWWTWACKLHNYTFRHFWDTKKGGEMFGYLDRRGEVNLHQKGGKWKGCFHVPRALWKAAKLMQDLADHPSPARDTLPPS